MSSAHTLVSKISRNGRRAFSKDRRIPLLAAVLLSLRLDAAPARASTLEEIQSRGYILWGADKEGGGPYVYPDPSDPSKILGFEVEFADMLALEMGRSLGRPIHARFSQGQWDTLPSLLTTGRVDIILNGYEWTPERARLMDATIPYYVYELQLLARSDELRFTKPSNLPAQHPRKVGVLGGSAAEMWLREHFPNGEVAVISYDGTTSAMSDVVADKLDATLQDLPIAIFYANDFPTLMPMGEPVGPGRYVIYVRKGDRDLRELLDRAIVALRDRGALRSLYERYGIWTAIQNDPEYLSLPGSDEDPASRPIEERTSGSMRSGASTSSGASTGSAVSTGSGIPTNPDSQIPSGPSSGASASRPAGDEPGHGLLRILRKHGATLLRAAGMTIVLSISSMPIAIVLGLLIAIGRLYGPLPLRGALGAYVELLRGTPLMLQLFVIFFLLPRIGIVIAALPAAIAGLAINYSAYEAEIYRAGIQAIPTGQMDAALSLGMSRVLALRRIVLPQAVRLVIPPVTNDFIALFKDTSVCSVITVVELTKQYNIAVMSSPSEILPLAAIAAGLYLMMSYPLSILASRLERR